MNRTLMFGIAVFVALIGIALVGDQRLAKADYGGPVCHGRPGCGGRPVCHGCYGPVSCFGGARIACAGIVDCYGGRGFSGCAGCYGPPRVAQRRSYVAGHCHGWADGYGPNCYGLSCFGSACHGATCYGTSCYGSGCDGCFGTSRVTPALQAPHEAEPNDAATHPAASQAVYFSVEVPADATIWVNGRPTKSTGTERHFVSRVSSSDRTYPYEVRVEAMRDGFTVVKSNTARLRAGERATLRFTMEEQPAAEHIAQRGAN